MKRKLLLSMLLACSTAHPESIPLIHAHGTFLVPVVINDKISLNFTIDSGASDVSIPADVFSTLTRAGTIEKGDFLDLQVYELADGTTRTSQRFRIRSLRVGSVELRDVVASVAPMEGSLLLGQSFLSRMKSWSIDNERHVLVFNKQWADSTVGATQPRPRATPPQSAAMAQTDGGNLLKAVAFALTGDDSSHVSDWPDCVFQIKSDSPPEVLTFHLNNIDPARTRVAEESLAGIEVHIFGENVVVDEYGSDPGLPVGTVNGPKVLTHHTQWRLKIHTIETQRMLRAWNYIYSHGCTGQKSSF